MSEHFGEATETRVIRTATDIRQIRDAGCIGQDYLRLIEAHFSTLAEGLGNGIPGSGFDLERHGPMYLIERGDNPLDLRSLGVRGGITDLRPEYVERFQADGKVLCRIAQMYTNDFLVFIYIAPGEFPGEVSRWLLEQLGDDEAAIPDGGIAAVPFDGEFCSGGGDGR